MAGGATPSGSGGINGGNSDQPMDAPLNFAAMMKRPSAWLPVAMSLAALTVAAVHLIRFGTVREADEGTSAHLWQLLMAGQLPVIAFFAVKWLPGNPRSALAVLALQVGAMLVALAPVYFLHW